jgi:demethylmenaquinone methyltransferase/2-methoxy-6-polyprenyl-1,4-benzoquinol methylase
MGGVLTGEGEAYQYLQKSSAQFPSQEKFIDLMKQAYKFEKMNCAYKH